MRVAALYDIHGNLPALDAVLGEVRREGIDHLVVGGDVVPGPMIREALERLLHLDIPVQFIRGNCELEVLAELNGVKSTLPEQYRVVTRWSGEQLSQDQQGFMTSWPKTLRLEIPGIGAALFCHGTPQNENDIFTRRTPEERLLPVFTDVNADLVICGHTHMQFDRMIGRVRVLNAGSVGMPFGRAGADWLVLGPGVELRHTEYDLARAAEQIRATSYPQVETFVADYVLKPPSEEKMLEAFAKAELK
jgi:putative phosphoesterase